MVCRHDLALGSDLKEQKNLQENTRPMKVLTMKARF